MAIIGQPSNLPPGYIEPQDAIELEGTLTIKLGDSELTRKYRFEKYNDSPAYISTKLYEDLDEMVETLLSDNEF